MNANVGDKTETHQYTNNNKEIKVNGKFGIQAEDLKATSHKNEHLALSRRTW